MFKEKETVEEEEMDKQEDRVTQNINRLKIENELLEKRNACMQTELALLKELYDLATGMLLPILFIITLFNLY